MILPHPHLLDNLVAGEMNIFDTMLTAIDFHQFCYMKQEGIAVY
jgi:hypothetical protein